MSQERWDVVVQVLNGSMKVLGEQTLRGPVVRIGADPGPGGFKLNGYRGLDARQAVITAYDGGTASVAPVGRAQVRMAPHAHVNWKEIDPITGPEYLSEGCAVHLGPVGRGATIEFKRCQKLAWQGGGLASEVGVGAPGVAGAGMGIQGPGGMAQVAGAGQVQPGGYVQPTIDARRVGTIQASSVPVWFIGGLVVMFGMMGTLVAILIITQRQVEGLGPEAPGMDFYQTANPAAAATADPEFKEGINQAFYQFVMKPNGEAAGQLEYYKNPEVWDSRFKDYVLADALQRLKAWNFFKRLDQVKGEYSTVVQALRKAGLPDVFGAIPYTESRYKSSTVSYTCADGWWQFMPEVAYRLEVKDGLDFQVRDCRLKAKQTTWSPSDAGLFSPPKNVYVNGDYMYDRKCDISSCATDDRKDLIKSTQAAIHTLRQAWDDQTIRGSGAAVQLTITSHNAGYNDRLFGSGKKTNVLPAYRRYVKGTGQDPAPHFMGAMVRCEEVVFGSSDFCGSYFPGEAQHYAYRTIATHILAACYYGTNYSNDPAWAAYAEFAQSGYCTQFAIPDSRAIDQALRKQ